MWIGVSILVVAFILVLARAIWLEHRLRDTKDNLAWEISEAERVHKALYKARDEIDELTARNILEAHRRSQLEFELSQVKTAVHRVGWAKEWN